MIHDLYAVFWGATWGNNTAWLESLALTGLTVYLLRDRIGKRLAAWWHRHHAPHLRAEIERIVTASSARADHRNDSSSNPTNPIGKQ